MLGTVFRSPKMSKAYTINVISRSEPSPVYISYTTSASYVTVVVLD